MRVIPGGVRPWPVAAAVAVLAALALLTLPLAAGVSAEAVTVGAGVVFAATASRKSLFRWPSLLTVLLLVILFIPIRRYVLPGNLPFQLEPYRLLIALLAVGWLTSLLIDPRVRLRRTGFEAPLFLFLVAVAASIYMNHQRISEFRLDTNVAKSLSFLLGFLIVLYLPVSVLRRRSDVERLMKLLVAGGAVIAVLAVIEFRTGANLFNHLNFIPFLNRDNSVELPVRNGRLRAYGPAEHPIALGAALAMLVPLAAYFAYTIRRRIWWAAAALIALGCLATISRTAVLMLGVEAIVFVILRPRQAVRMWPAVLPFLLAVHFALPGTLGTLKESFFPKGGLVADQQGYQGTGRFGNARLTPTFNDVNSHQLFGIGYGTRILGGPGQNALILDDQWLDTTLETGIVGAFAWVWLLVRVIRRIGGEAKADLSERGLLLTALVAAVTGFGISMITYDAFSFVQVTLLFFLLVSFATVLVPAREAVRAPAPAPASDAALAGHLAAKGFGLIAVAGGLVLFTFTHVTSIRLLSLVLIVMCLGTWALEASRRQRMTRATRPQLR